MVLVNVCYKNGALAASTVKINNGDKQPIENIASKEAAILESYAKSQLIDETNCDWIIESSKTAQAVEIEFCHPTISSECEYEKGGVVMPGSQMYSSLNNLVEQVLNPLL